MTGVQLSLRYLDTGRLHAIPLAAPDLSLPVEPPTACFGREARLAHRLRRSYPGLAAWQRFFLRPAMEPIVLTYWPRLIAGGLDAATAEEMASCLAGQRLAARTGPIVTLPDARGRQTRYPPVDQAAGWLGRLTQQDDPTLPPFLNALAAYAQVAISHPFTDGNGRMARALFLATLGRAGAIPGPVLPLGPLVYLHHRRLGQALGDLGTTGSWASLASVMSEIVEAAAAFVHQDTRPA